LREDGDGGYFFLVAFLADFLAVFFAAFFAAFLAMGFSSNSERKRSSSIRRGADHHDARSPRCFQLYVSDIDAQSLES
jgi:hypothetical protein